MTTKAPPTLVFIHGILSSHETFLPTANHIRATMPRWDLVPYNYDFNKPIIYNGMKFGHWLETEAKTSSNSDFVIVAHSMGGLVSRVALLMKKLPFVSKLFMLGTPNFGAIRPCQLSAAMQLGHHLTNRVSALFIEERGILELTNVYEILGPLIDSGKGNCSHIEFITIPGCYFHKHRNMFSKARGTFGYLYLLAERLGLTLNRPHDGIVEAESNNMAAGNGAGYWSEKADAIQSRSGMYAHIEPRVSEDLIHTEIQRDLLVANDMIDIINSPSLLQWCMANGGRGTHSITPWPM